jgi:ribose 5-phosphate isomerase B
MRISVGADHAGFVLKERLKQHLTELGHEVVDEGTNSEDSVDYPDFAAAVARQVAAGKADRGLLVCSSGVGMSIVANKVDGVRAALGTNEEEVRLTREHNDANVLTIGAKFTDEHTAERLTEVFLRTAFLGGRHARRVAKIAELENQ